MAEIIGTLSFLEDLILKYYGQLSDNGFVQILQLCGMYPVQI